MKTTRKELNDAIETASLGGRVVALHSSLSSFGYLEGGAQSLVDAFLKQGCTLLVPAFTYFCEAPVQRQIERNGGCPSVDEDESPVIFTGAVDQVSKEMGAIPRAVLRAKGCERGFHPLNSFAAVGPRAKELISRQTLLDVYGPYRALMADKEAVMLLAGVDFTSATPIHFAELLAGRELFRRWGWTEQGIVETCVGSCSGGFGNLEAPLAGVGKCVQVGVSDWKVYPFVEFIKAATGLIRSHPMITHCEDSDCERCRDAVAGGPTP